MIRNLKKKHDILFVKLTLTQGGKLKSKYVDYINPILERTLRTAMSYSCGEGRDYLNSLSQLNYGL